MTESDGLREDLLRLIELAKEGIDPSLQSEEQSAIYASVWDGAKALLDEPWVESYLTTWLRLRSLSLIEHPMLLLEELLNCIFHPSYGALERIWMLHESNGSSINMCNAAIDLFWAVWEDFGGQNTLLDESVRAGTIDNPRMELLFDRLGRLEQDCRVPYQPDVYPYLPTDLYLSLKIMTGAHLAAARAIALMAKHGYTEDAEASLRDAAMAGKWLGVERESSRGGPSVKVARQALHGIVQCELYRIHRQRGDEEQALNLLTCGLACLDDAMTVDRTLQDTEPEPQWLARLGANLEMVDIKPQKAVDLTEAIFSRAKSSDWKQLAANWRNLTELNDAIWDVGNEYIHTKDFSEVSMISYAYAAIGRAMERCNPSDLMELRDRQEEGEIERRLREYFFPDGTWTLLPEKTREYLITADRVFLNPGKGRLPSILFDLQNATETLLNVVVWQPVLNSRHRTTGENLVVRRHHGQVHHSPTLADFAQMCREQWFSDFLKDRNADSNEVQLFTKILPRLISRLSRLRNDETHDASANASGHDIRAIYNDFLGIGQPVSCQSWLVYYLRDKANQRELPARQM